MPETVKNPSATVGLKRLVYWPLEKDTDTELAYGDAYEFGKVLMTLQDDPNVASEPLNADDVVVEEIVVVDGGKIVLGVTDLTSGERVMLLGETLKNGTNITNINNLSGYGCIGCMTKRADGKYNLKKYFKVKFTPGSETSETVQRGSIKYVTQQLSGNYNALINNGDSRAIRKAVDIEVDAEIVNQWFADATYVGPADSSESAATSADDDTEGGDDTPQG